MLIIYIVLKNYTYLSYLSGITGLTGAMLRGRTMPWCALGESEFPGTGTVCNPSLHHDCPSLYNVPLLF